MAENIPNMPTGAVPPKPGDSAKVQPKKETVRINLPPKPTAAPTVRLPTPSAAGVGAPTTSAAAPTASVAASTPASAAAAPAAQRATPVAAVAPRQVVAAPATVIRPVTGSAVKGLDKGLALAAAIIGLAAAGHILFLSLN